MAGASGQTIIEADDLAPDAVDGAFSARDDKELSGNVISDDTDLNNDTLRFVADNGQVLNAAGSVIELATGGTLTILSNGDFSFQPTSAGGIGDITEESFTYLASDGNGGTSMATLSIAVPGINNVPVEPELLLKADEETAFDGSLLADASDAEGDDIFVSAAVIGDQELLIDEENALNEGGTLVINQDGSVSLDTAGDYEALGFTPATRASCPLHRR